MLQWLKDEFNWLVLEFKMFCWDLVPSNPNGVKPRKGEPQEAEGISCGNTMDSMQVSEA